MDSLWWGTQPRPPIPANEFGVQIYWHRGRPAQGVPTRGGSEFGREKIVQVTEEFDFDDHDLHNSVISSEGTINQQDRLSGQYNNLRLSNSSQYSYNS